MNRFKVNDPISTSLIVHALIQSHPNFTYLPERKDHTLCLTACPLSKDGQTIKQSNAYLTSNLNSISLCQIHATTNPNHPKSALIWTCVGVWEGVLCIDESKKREWEGENRRRKRINVQKKLNSFLFYLLLLQPVIKCFYFVLFCNRQNLQKRKERQAIIHKCTVTKQMYQHFVPIYTFAKKCPVEVLPDLSYQYAVRNRFWQLHIVLTFIWSQIQHLT